MQSYIKYYLVNAIYRLFIIIFMVIVFMPILVLAAEWDVKPYLFEYISEKIVNRAIYIEFKVLDDRCVQMRPSLTGEVDWGDGEITKLERLNCERWRIPHIYKKANTYTITVKVENLTAQIPGVTISEEGILTESPLPSLPPPSSLPPSSTPSIPPQTQPPPSPATPNPPSIPPLPSGAMPDFTANFTCDKSEVIVGEKLNCQATGLSANADPSEFFFEWSLSNDCEDEDFPLKGQGEKEIEHIFNLARSCYINLLVTHLPTETQKGGPATLITIKEKSALRSFFDSLLAFFKKPQTIKKEIKEEIAIAQIQKSKKGNITVKLVKIPPDLKLHSCRLDFGDGAYLAVSDFSKNYFYQFQNPGVYVVSLLCLDEKNKELKSNFGIEIDIIE